MTVVVSEETGGVTITNNSHLMIDMSRDDYMAFLTAQLVPAEDEEKHNPIRDFILGINRKGAGK